MARSTSGAAYPTYDPMILLDIELRQPLGLITGPVLTFRVFAQKGEAFISHLHWPSQMFPNGGNGSKGSVYRFAPVLYPGIADLVFRIRVSAALPFTFTKVKDTFDLFQTRV